MSVLSGLSALVVWRRGFRWWVLVCQLHVNKNIDIDLSGLPPWFSLTDFRFAALYPKRSTHGKFSKNSLREYELKELSHTLEYNQPEYHHTEQQLGN